MTRKSGLREGLEVSDASTGGIFTSNLLQIVNVHINDVGLMGQAVNQRSGHDGISTRTKGQMVK